MNFGLPDFMQAWLWDLRGFPVVQLWVESGLSVLYCIILEKKTVNRSSHVISKWSSAKSFGSRGLSTN